MNKFGVLDCSSHNSLGSTFQNSSKNFSGRILGPAVQKHKSTHLQLLALLPLLPSLLRVEAEGVCTRKGSSHTSCLLPEGLLYLKWNLPKGSLSNRMEMRRHSATAGLLW